jgi:hypothetical protein
VKTNVTTSDGLIWLVELYVAQAADTKWYAKIEIKLNGVVKETYYSNAHKTESEAIKDGKAACEKVKVELEKDNGICWVQ